MLIGHEKQKKYFKNIVKNGSLGHAYLFTGPEMIGKRTFALDLLSVANGRDNNDPDLFFLAPDKEEGESKIYIEDIRKLKSFLRLKPYQGPYKFAIIDDAHCLTNEASNALLKILEEPPAFSVLILVSSLPKLIPATIVSRCERVRFTEADVNTALEFVGGRKLKKEDKEFLLKLAGGRIGFINYLLEENRLADARKAVEDLRKLLNSRVYEKFNYAKRLHDKAAKSYSREIYPPLVSYWLSWVAAHVRTSPKNEKIVKELLALNSIVSQPQYNHRLALENFLLNL